MKSRVIDLRKKAVNDGRCMVRVRWIESQELITAAVCPGCWNDPNRRFSLIKQMEKMGVEPVHKADLEDGIFRNKEHAPKCPHKIKIEKSWKKFKLAVNNHKNRNI